MKENNERRTAVRKCENSMYKAMQAAHTDAYSYVINYIKDKVIKDKIAVRLTDLCLLYINSLEATDYDNPNYRAEKLKQKLENDEDLKSKISFALAEPESGLPFVLVYSTGMT